MENPFNGSTVFSRRITVIQGSVRLRDEFWSGDRGDLQTRFWIISSSEVIRERFFFQCQSLASVTFEADTKVS
jgi:hypothetical protein